MTAMLTVSAISRLQWQHSQQV